VNQYISKLHYISVALHQLALELFTSLKWGIGFQSINGKLSSIASHLSGGKRAHGQLLWKKWCVVTYSVHSNSTCEITDERDEQYHSLP